MYLTLLYASWRNCSRVRNDARARDDKRLTFFAHTGQGIQASMAGFMVSSTFGSLMHFDLMYHLCALSACLPVAYKAEVDRITTEDGYRALQEGGVAYEAELPDVEYGPVVVEERAVGGTASTTVGVAREEVVAAANRAAATGADGPVPERSGQVPPVPAETPEPVRSAERVAPERPWTVRTDGAAVRPATAPPPPLPPRRAGPGHEEDSVTYLGGLDGDDTVARALDEADRRRVGLFDLFPRAAGRDDDDDEPAASKQ